MLRFSLAEKMKACCEVLRLQFDDRFFKNAKRVRDSLSHGSKYQHAELVEAESYVRELARHVLKRMLESKGVFLDGVPAPLAELPGSAPSTE